MAESKFNKILTILLVVAIVGWAAYSKYSITTNAEDVASDFEEQAKKKKEEQEEGERLQIGGVDQGESIYNSSKTEVQKYYGYEIVGTISIPKIKIKYPILRKINNSIYKGSSCIS